jgi:DNA polymerase III delta subunit
MGNWLERTSILNKIKEAIGDYELEVYDESYGWEYVKQSITENSCFGENRLIILTGLPTVKGKDASASRTKVLNDLKKILPNVDGNTCVVLNGITITSKTFMKAVNGTVDIRSFDNMVPKRNASGSAVKRITDYFDKKGKRIADEDAFLVVDSINFNSKDVSLDKVFLMANKIEDIVGSRKNITHDDVMSICSQSPDFLIWNLFKALDDRNFAEALSLVDKIASRSMSFEHEIVMALSTMIWKYRLLLFVRTSLDKGFQAEEVWGRLQRMVKWDKKGQGVRRFSLPQKTKKDNKNISMFSRQAMNMLFYDNYGTPTIAKYPKEHLLHILPITQMCLRKIRSGCTEGEVRIVLEILCLVICYQVPYETAEDILKSNYCL